MPCQGFAWSWLWATLENTHALQARARLCLHQEGRAIGKGAAGWQLYEEDLGKPQIPLARLSVRNAVGESKGLSCGRVVALCDSYQLTCQTYLHLASATTQANLREAK